MIDPLTLLVGATILAVGFLAGRITRRRSTPQTPLPTCGCGHGLDQHDPETKMCHAQHPRSKFDTGGDWVGYTYVPCTCRQYVGPRPLEEMFAQQYLPPAD